METFASLVIVIIFITLSKACLKCDPDFEKKFDSYRSRTWGRSSWVGDVSTSKKYIDEWRTELRDEWRQHIPKEDLKEIAEDIYKAMDEQYKLSGTRMVSSFPTTTVSQLKFGDDYITSMTIGISLILVAGGAGGLGRIKAYVGIHSPSKDARPNQGILVQDKFYPNPNYTLPSRENDILLLRLSQDVTLSANVQLIQYASRATVLAPGTHCSVAGWGRTSKDPASKSDVLREVQVDILNRTKCAGKILTNKMICARGTGVKGTCRGDSGGPLVCKVGNVDTAVGVVSFSKPGNCDDPNRCNVYTKVSEYQTWIDDVLNGIPP
ncbi:CELA1 elastase, partial [Polypterus senegalus]